MSEPGFYRRIGKRGLDITGAMLLLLLASPILAGVALLVLARLGRPVLFRQTRPGRHGAPFEILKFRSMLPAAAGDDDASRLTPFGRRLRASALDELPELVNVLRGEMSLVGPRPLLPAYLPRYSARQARRHEVLPGITGWAQIHGRNKLGWPERLEMDVHYVDNLSLMLDLRILARTVGLIVRRTGSSADGHATMPEFRGDGEGPSS